MNMAMEASGTAPVPRVLRLPRVHKKKTKNEDDFVLVHVSQDPEAREPLDLKLIGTEGENVFAVSLKHNETSKLKTSALTQEEWDGLLSSILLGTLPEDGGKTTDGVETTAEIAPKSKPKADPESMTINIQKRVEGITQKYGELILFHTEEEEASLFDWGGLAAQSNEQSRRELQNLRKTLREKDAQVKKLESSNAELAKLKKDNENQLLEKFALLLNEKKLKIRDQQRLLASSTVDPTKVQEVGESRETRSRSVGASRKGKRKATVAEDDDESDAFEKMDVDEKVEEDSEQEPARTPEPSETETVDDDSEHGLQSKSNKVVSTIRSKPQARAPPTAKTPETTVIPPQRELPFAKKKEDAAAPQKQSESAIHEDSETEDDDDEL